jgi:hypothetical protein
MRNFANNFGDFTAGSGLYRVWVSEHCDGGERLVSIWIDPAMTVFELEFQDKADGIGTAAGAEAQTDCVTGS